MTTDLTVIVNEATMTVSLSDEAQYIVDQCDEEAKRYLIASMEMFLITTLGNIYVHKDGGQEVVKLASSLLCDHIALHGATMIDIIRRA